MKAKYYIYRNLNKGNCFSVKHKGKVILRGEEIEAVNVTFKVSKAGRERALKTGRRNVHAYAATDALPFIPSVGWALVDIIGEVKYNPFVADHFTLNGQPLDFAEEVMMKYGKMTVYETFHTQIKW